MVLHKLIDAVRRRMGHGSPDFATRLRRIDSWLDELSLTDARHQALGLVGRSEWFSTDPGDVSATLPTEAPPSIRELYSRYRLIRGRFCDLRLNAKECQPSAVDPSMLRIGWNDSHVELCTRAGADTIYRLANDVPKAEAQEGSARSVYHAILRVGATLEYVTPPPAAA
jgi:hypothetical protein